MALAKGSTYPLLPEIRILLMFFFLILQISNLKKM